MTKKRAAIWVCEVRYGETWKPCPFIGADNYLWMAKEYAKNYIKKSGAMWATKNGKLSKSDIRFRRYISEKPL